MTGIWRGVPVSQDQQKLPLLFLISIFVVLVILSLTNAGCKAGREARDFVDEYELLREPVLGVLLFGEGEGGGMALQSWSVMLGRTSSYEEKSLLKAGQPET
jgi:hypothetical protein